MLKSRVITWLLLFISFLSFELCAEELMVSDFAAAGLAPFSEKRFVHKTEYELVVDDGRTVLKATTNASASALYREIKIDLQKTPFLNWQWRVENIYTIADQTIKQGDDYPARIYVMVKEGIFPWQTKALNYVWSNSASTKAYWSNPFTDKAVMIPVRSGALGLGQWQQQRVNVAADFQRIFGRKISAADGVAIMTDADNHGGSAVAFYADIRFSD